MVDIEFMARDIVGAFRSYNFKRQKYTVYALNLAAGWLGDYVSSSGGTNWGDVVANLPQTYTLIGTDIADALISSNRDKTRDELRKTREQELTRRREFIANGVQDAQREMDLSFQRGDLSREGYRIERENLRAAVREANRQITRDLPDTYPIGYRIASVIPSAVRMAVFANLYQRDVENWNKTTDILKGNVFDFPLLFPAVIALTTTTLLGIYTARETYQSLGNAGFFTREYWSGFDNVIDGLKNKMNTYVANAMGKLRGRPQGQPNPAQAQEPPEDVIDWNDQRGI